MSKQERARREAQVSYHDRQYTVQSAIAGSDPSVKKRKAATALCRYHKAQRDLWRAYVRTYDASVIAKQKLVGAER